MTLVYFDPRLFFLNLIKSVRENHLLSFLTFSGVPLVGVAYLIPSVSIDFYSQESFMRTLVGFSTAYLVITSVEFFMFRKSIRNTK